jgi:sugar/nucleoside kinase (ribokinase family)
MAAKAAEVTVAGHVCLDIIPVMNSASNSASSSGLGEWLVPGSLVQVGPAVMATGGAVSNTGVALHRLGIATLLMGKVGDDLFGGAILDLLNRNGPSLADKMIVAPGEQSSYSIVISPPDIDRIFLHCTGTNDTFSFADIDMDEVGSTRLFHFGYPPLMKNMYEEEGAQLAELLANVKQRGVTVTLDMAKPDPNSAAGRADWVRILERVLPYVDFFFPSFEEILFMLDRYEYESLMKQYPDGDIIRHAAPKLLAKLSDELLSMGAATVMIKLGDHGIYVRSTSARNRWQQVGRCAPEQLAGWLGRELLAPVLQVEVVGTTGAGDCTIAGFLAGLVKGLPIEATMTAATAVGACNVEKADAISGIPLWEDLEARIMKGWAQRELIVKLQDWDMDARAGIWIGPNDCTRQNHE